MIRWIREPQLWFILAYFSGVLMGMLLLGAVTGWEQPCPYPRLADGAPMITRAPDGGWDVYDDHGLLAQLRRR